MKTTPELLIKEGFVYNEIQNSYDMIFESGGLLSIAESDYSFFIGNDHKDLGFCCNKAGCLITIDMVRNLIIALTNNNR